MAPEGVGAPKRGRSLLATSADLSQRKGGRPISRRPRLKRKHRIFLTVNVIVWGCIGIAVFTNPHASFGAAAYVALLSFICTLPLLFATSYRGRASLLIVFLAYYFATFGLSDLVSLFSSPLGASPYGTGPSWGSATAILLGALCFLLGYAVTTRLPVYRASGWSAREWAPRATAVVGIACWAIGWIATVAAQFGGEGPNSGPHTNPMIGGFLTLARLLQPVGAMLLIYLYLTAREKKILATLIAIMALNIGLGFFGGGAKLIAIEVPVLFLLSFVLLRERIPVFTLIVFTLATAVLFNVFQSYRNSLWSSGESRGAALSQIVSGNATALKAGVPLGQRVSKGLEYFVSRISARWVIDLVVARTGRNGIPFQDGATLTPLFYIFIPRLVAPDKPNNVIGRLFNHTFSIASANTYIAVTNLGDLYWNFGWPGIVIGMTIIGAFLAWAATKFRLDRNPTLPKFLFLMVTALFLVLRFEDGIALIYTIWARGAVLLLLLHAVMPKARNRRKAKPQRVDGGAVTPDPPNLTATHPR